MGALPGLYWVAMDEEDYHATNEIPRPLTLLYCSLLGAVFGEGASAALDFGFELFFDLFRKGWLREPFYSLALDGLHYGSGVLEGACFGFFMRLLSERSWRSSAAWAFVCVLGVAFIASVLSTTFSRAVWDMRHAPFEIAAIALGCALGARLCLQYEDREQVRGVREMLWRFVTWR